MLLACCGQALAAAPIEVFVSVLPLQTVVERLGGERVEVRVMVGPGHSPATYEPTPSQMAQLAEADLSVRVGVPFDQAWMQRLVSINSDMKVVDAREGITLRAQEAHHHGAVGAAPAHAAHDAELDPQIWTSPRLVKAMAQRIRDALVDLDPAHREH